MTNIKNQSQLIVPLYQYTLGNKVKFIQFDTKKNLTQYPKLKESVKLLYF